MTFIACLKLAKVGHNVIFRAQSMFLKKTQKTSDKFTLALPRRPPSSEVLTLTEAGTGREALWSKKCNVRSNGFMERTRRPCGLAWGGEI